MQSERQQLFYRVNAVLAKRYPSVWEQVLNYIAFALMDMVAWIDHKVWQNEQYDWHRLDFSGRQWIPATRDGWRAARYV